ncbi:MAG: trigger factor [Galactobacillus timonensis]|jgi:trigger factor|uniref:trigger factor n=1 Tax=Galactobacillus timonensis TaxID=2041840 RepID=UPI0023F57834|nr:trigger factor [Galactobacillus timonensis]MCI6068247.1 trigger factor [Galactobacillus timonensis]MDD6679634.1 trigger factor [Galactobacillus timonensis]
MNTEWELKEKSTGTMTVTVDGEDWKKAVDKAFRKLGSKAEIKGFRKGQVPAKMLEKIIPERERWIEAVNDNANDWLRAGLDDKKLEPISRPMLDVKDMDADHVAVTYDFAVRPEVEMGEYKGLDYTVADSEVSDDELNAELDRMRKQYADMEVKDGEAADGDTVNINYEGFRDGVAFEGGKAENYNLTLGSHSFIPGFEEGLVGVKAGEDKELNLTFPEDYYHEDLRGASVVFKVHVNEVKHEVLPELDDDFAKDVNAPGVENVEDLKKLVKDRLASSKKSKAEDEAEEKLIDQLIAAEKVDLPEVMIDNEVEDMVSNRENYFKQQGLTLDMYLKYTGSDLDAFKKSLRPDAERTVRMRLALEKIAELEKLEPTDEDYEKEYKNIADAYQMDIDTVKKLVDKSYITEGLRSQLAMDFVKKNAKGAVEEAK